MTDRKKLREAAMKAMDPKCRVDDASTYASFKALCTPQTILSLLDDLDRPVGEVVALPEAFVTANSGDCEYFVKIKCQTMSDMHRWHDAVLSAYRASLAPSPAIGRETRPGQFVRVCPERDAKCPHGAECPYSIDRYRCNLAGSRAALGAQP